jgi:hypothetical protein
MVQVRRVGRDGYVRVIASDVTLCQCHEEACKGRKNVLSKLVLQQKTRRPAPACWVQPERRLSSVDDLHAGSARK